MSKGSGRRPREVELETFNKNWENIFGRDKRNNRDNQSSQSDSIHSGKRTEVCHSKSFSSGVGKSTEDSKVNADERGKRKRGGKGSLCVQP